MFPFIKDKETVTIEYFETPVPLSQLSLGEVVLIRSENEWVLHRIVGGLDRKVTKGDWSNNFDNVDSAWGIIKEQRLNSFSKKFISFFSAKLVSNSSFKRKFFRALLFLYFSLLNHSRMKN